MLEMRNAKECADKDDMTTGYVYIAAEKITSYVGAGQHKVRKLSDQELVKRAERRGYSLIVDRYCAYRRFWVRKL